MNVIHFKENIIDVLIIGAGPTGTMLAIELARRGHQVRIIEKNDSSFPGSRAKGIQPRTLEIFYDIGIIEEVLEAGSLYPKMGIHLGPFTIPKAMLKNVDPSTDIPYPNTYLIAQYQTDAILHQKLQSLGVAVEYGKSLVEFSHDEESVRSKISFGSNVEEITARFMIGADGGSSTVRKGLGIEFQGSTNEQDRILIADAEVTGLSRDRWHIWPKLGGKFIGACPLPHTNLFQWMIRLSADEVPPTGFEAISQRIKSHISASAVQLHHIRWTSIFRPNIRLAANYRKGRVFIAGDAAHVHTPAGAQGLNTGIQDAYNLGWKLAQVLAGATDSLLETYEEERRPIAAAVLGLSTKKYEAIGKLAPSSLKRGKDEQQLALTYAGGPLVAPNGAATKNLHSGDRVPDAEFLKPDYQETTLFSELKGTHFTIIAYGEWAVEKLKNLKWPSKGAELKVINIGKNQAYNDHEEGLKTNLGIVKDTLILIRPDKYIGYIATEDTLGIDAAIIAKLTGLNT